MPGIPIFMTSMGEITGLSVGRGTADAGPVVVLLSAVARRRQDDYIRYIG